MPHCEYGLWLLDAGPLGAPCGDPAVVRAWFAPPGARQRLVVCLCGWHDGYLCGEGGREELPVVSRAVLATEESARGLLG
jgi:hypothetical protein